MKNKGKTKKAICDKCGNTIEIECEKCPYKIHFTEETLLRALHSATKTKKEIMEQLDECNFNIEILEKALIQLKGGNE